MPCGGSAPRTVKASWDAHHEASSVAWEGWGTSLAWWAHSLGHDARTRDAICGLLFGKDGAALNIVRYNLGGANQDHVADYRPGAAVPCFAQPGGGCDWSVDPWQLAMLLKAADLGADTFEAFVNSPPWFWTVSGTSRGHKLPLKNNLAKEHIADFAEFCAEVVDHFKTAHGITFQSLSPFNEPASPAWCLAVNCKQEACYFSKSRSHKVLRTLLEQPALQGTQLVGFEQFCIRDTLSDLHHLPKQLRSAVGRVNTHTYDSSTFFAKAAKPLVLLQDNGIARWRLRRLLQRWGGKPLWVSEWGTGRGALQTAEHVVRDLATLLPSAYVWWQAVEGVGSGWGLLEMPIDHPPPGPHARSSSSLQAAAGAEQAQDAPGGDPAVTTTATSTTAASVGAEAGGAQAGGQQQQPSPQAPGVGVRLHPNFFVMRFLVKSVPVGSRLCRVKGFGTRGFAVQLPPAAAPRGSWSLVYVNPSRATEHVLHVSLDLGLLAAAPAQAAAQAQDASGSAAGDARVGEDGTNNVTVAVQLLDVVGLETVTLEVGGEGGTLPAAPPGVGVTTMPTRPPVGPDHVAVVSVPAGHLCRVDLVLG